MKTFRNIAIAFSFLLLVSGQVAWAIAPGSGHNKDKKDKQLHSVEGQAAMGPVSPELMESATEADLIVKPEAVEETNLVKTKNNASAKQQSRAKNQKNQPVSEAEGLIEEKSQEQKDAARHNSGFISSAVSHLIVLFTTLDRDELPVSDTTIAIFLMLLFFVPPLTVLASTREMKSEFWFNILLTSCLWVPGLIHASIVLNRQS